MKHTIKCVTVKTFASNKPGRRNIKASFVSADVETDRPATVSPYMGCFVNSTHELDVVPGSTYEVDANVELAVGEDGKPTLGEDGRQCRNLNVVRGSVFNLIPTYQKYRPNAEQAFWDNADASLAAMRKTIALELAGVHTAPRAPLQALTEDTTPVALAAPAVLS